MPEIFQSRSNLYYDFQKRWLPVKILGFFSILEESKLHLILNILLLICVLLLYLYLMFMAVVTMIAMTDATLPMAEAFYALGTITVAVTLPACKLITLKSSKKAAVILRQGVFSYEQLEEECCMIRRSQVNRIKKLISIFASAFTIIGILSLVSPLTKFLTRVDNTEKAINPYLPLPIMVPFNSYSVFGFSIAFLSEAIAIMFMQCTNACIEDMYISSVIQLGMEYEVLNHSLINIERRAYLKLIDKNPTYADNIPINQLYDSNEFQNCLYICLRENILHHQAILRLKNLVFPYLNATNFVAMLIISLLMAVDLLLFLENPQGQFAMIKEFFGFGALCWAGEVINETSSEVKNSLYSIPWHHCRKDFKRLMNVFMTSVQKPVELRVRAFDVVLNLETYANALALAYKLMNALR